MKIKREIREILGGEPILLTKLTIEEEKKFPNSPLNYVINIPLKDMRYTKCYKCKSMNINFCWNCKKPHCDKHARAIFIVRADMINTLCLECAKECEKIRRIIKV